MAEGYAKNGADFLRMRRSNTQYWDAMEQQWKTPEQACYYNGSQWIPFILSLPTPGTHLRGNSEGKVFRYSLSPGQSNTYYVHLLNLIDDAGYDAAAVKESEGDVTLRMRRAWGGSTTSGITFIIILRDSDDDNVTSTAAGVSHLVAQGEEFSLTFPRAKITNGMYFRWGGYDGGSENTGWEFKLDDSFILEF